MSGWEILRIALFALAFLGATIWLHEARKRHNREKKSHRKK